ncbi:MAG: HutD family protein [Flavobacteriales bacterium]|nr:HutD family protein [Flavobacteriales bacterium]
MKKPSIINNFKTTNWSGGTTTELFIYPPNSSYQERNFAFRLSTATVNINKSEFTSLPNVCRKIMVLDGAIELNHEQQYIKKLNPFQTDSFKGDWKTSCKGTCTDFNLMTTGNTSGNIEAITLNENDTHTYQPTKNANWLFIYAYTGQVSLNLKDNIYTLGEGHLFVLNEAKFQTIEIKSNVKSELIFTTVKTN